MLSVNKALGVVRLSLLTDESTSPQRQREQITYTAKARGGDPVHIVEDLDVSGTVSPFEREQLGPWLTDPGKIAQWDTLIVTKLDRLSRSLINFAEFMKWCEANNKTVVSVSEGVDFSTPTGRLLANILIMFAEFERERIAGRRREAQVKIRQQARWGGGHVPLGYVKRKASNGWVLVPDPGAVALIERIAADLIAGSSARSICGELTSEETLTPRGKSQWRPGGLIRIMRSATLKGLVVTAQGEIVRGDDGLPVRREPVLDDSTWRQVQEALDRASRQKSGQRAGAAPLLRVAFCGRCGSPMYRARKQGRDYSYYTCGSMVQGLGCRARGVRAEVLEDMVETALLHELADLPMLARFSQPADEDHSGEIAEREEFLAQIDADYADLKISGERHAALAALQEERLAGLRALPSRPASSGLAAKKLRGEKVGGRKAGAKDKKPRRTEYYSRYFTLSVQKLMFRDCPACG